MPSFKMPTPVKRPTSANYWIRKKVPADLRPVVGKTEIWATLGTSNERQANIRIGAVNASIEAEWARLRAEGARQPGAALPPAPAPYKLSHQTSMLCAGRSILVSAITGCRTRRPGSAGLG